MERINYINALRGLAAFCIVLIHTNIFIDDSQLLSQVWGHFLREWTAVFVLISGFLFQYLLPKYDQKKYFKSKIKNVIIPYLIISIPAILIYTLGFKSNHIWVNIPELLEHSYLYIVTFFLVTGTHLGPLWFIPVLILIFLTSKPLSVIGRNKKILFLFAFLSIFVIGLTSRPPDSSSNPLIAYVHFLPVYILGMFFCFNRHYLIKDKNKIFYFILFLSFFIAELYWNFNSSFSIYTKLFLFLYLCTVFMELPEKNIKPLNIMADISFAVYFLHGYFAAILILLIKERSFNFIIGLILNIGVGIIITALIFIIYYVMKKLKINTRILIGS